MINTSERPIVLRSGRKLHNAILIALSKALELLKPQLASLTRPRRINSHPFSKIFGASNRRPKVLFDAKFIEVVFDISQDTSQNSSNRFARSSLKTYLLTHEVPITSLPELKRGLKLALVDLWRQRAVLLPTTFTTASNFPLHLIDHPLLTWLRSLTPVAPKPTDKGNTEVRRLYFYGPRLLWATDWASPSDISLTDIASLQRAASLYQNQRSAVVIGSAAQLPLSAVATRALAAFGDQVTFNAQDLTLYSRWVLGKHLLQQSFDEFKNASRTKTKANSTLRAPKSEKAEPSKFLPDPADAADVHEALKERFCALRRSNRGDTNWIETEVPSYAC